MARRSGVAPPAHAQDPDTFEGEVDDQDAYGAGAGAGAEADAGAYGHPGDAAGDYDDEAEADTGAGAGGGGGTDDEGSDGEGDDGDLKAEEGVYEVEGIVDYKNGLYLVKWKGYPDSDNTWEKLGSDEAPALVEQFWEAHPHIPREGPNAASSGRKRSSTASSARGRSSSASSSRANLPGDAEEEDFDSSAPKRRKSDKNGRAPKVVASSAKSSRASSGSRRDSSVKQERGLSRGLGDDDDGDGDREFDDETQIPKDIYAKSSWEHDIKYVKSVRRDDKAGPNADGGLVVSVKWNQGYLTVHSADLIHRKCPQKLIKFYEEHLRFI